MAEKLYSPIYADNKHIVDYIAKYLRSEDKAKLLISTMSMSDSVIAGSFALAMYKDKHPSLNFEPNDMDIWCKDRTDFHTFCKTIMPDSLNYHEVTHDCPSREYEDVSTVRMLRKFQIPNTEHTISIIMHSGSTKQNWLDLLDSFDIDCCRIAWSPRDDKYIIHNSLKNSLDTMDPKFAITKMTFNKLIEHTELTPKIIDYNVANILKRVTKYSNRGWVIYYGDKVQHFIQDPKTIDRGFVLRIHATYGKKPEYQGSTTIKCPNESQAKPATIKCPNEVDGVYHPDKETVERIQRMFQKIQFHIPAGDCN